jgi:hypothetical protein
MLLSGVDSRRFLIVRDLVRVAAIPSTADRERAQCPHPTRTKGARCVCVCVSVCVHQPIAVREGSFVIGKGRKKEGDAKINSP